jgi:hypothetical protein
MFQALCSANRPSSRDVRFIGASAVSLVGLRETPQTRSAKYVAPGGAVPRIVEASFQPRLIASPSPRLSPWPPKGEWICAASPVAIGPGRGKPKVRQADVGAGDAAQDRLQLVQHDWLGSVESASVEIDHRDRPRQGEGVHARRRVVPGRRTGFGWWRWVRYVWRWTSENRTTRRIRWPTTSVRASRFWRNSSRSLSANQGSTRA